VACTLDTDTVDLTESGGQLSADVRINPDPANALSSDSDGLFVTGQNETGWFDVSAEDEWVYSGADAPSYAFSIVNDKTSRYSAGQRVRYKQGGGFQYGIITAVSYDAGSALTTVTFYGGTDYTLANADITDNAFSGLKTPTGFPMDPTKWTEVLTDASDRTQAAPSANTWYNVGSLQITIPIGAWDVWWSGEIRCAYSSGQGTWDVFGSLSTNPSAESDNELTAAFQTGLTVSNGNRIVGSAHKRKFLVLGSKTVYYPVVKTASSGGSSLGLYGSTYAPSLVRVLCAYL